MYAQLHTSGTYIFFSSELLNLIGSQYDPNKPMMQQLHANAYGTYVSDAEKTSDFSSFN